MAEVGKGGVKALYITRAGSNKGLGELANNRL